MNYEFVGATFQSPVLCDFVSLCLPAVGREGVPEGGGWIELKLGCILASIHLRHSVPPPPKEDKI